MFLALVSVLLSSLIFTESPSDGEENMNSNDEGDPIDNGSSIGSLLDSLEDEDDYPVEEGALYQLFEGTAMDNEIAVIGDGLHGKAVLDRGLIETSIDWNETIDGLGGEDTIYAQDGHFLLYGGSDDDVLIGENASGLAFGGDGHDSIEVSGSHWIASGDAGDDTIMGSDGSVTLIGGVGSDIVSGGEGDDLVVGHGLWYTEPATGNVRISDLLSDAQDMLIGGEGNDTLIATAGDVVSASDGSDAIIGYISLGQEPIQISAADATDSIIIEIVVPEDFDIGLLDATTQTDTEDGGITFSVAGYPVVHFSEAAATAISDFTIRVSFHDADGRFLG